MKSSEVCIKTKSPLASLPFKDQVTKRTTGEDLRHISLSAMIRFFFLNRWVSAVAMKV